MLEHWLTSLNHKLSFNLEIIILIIRFIDQIKADLCSEVAKTFASQD